jgi:hypothetical protein
MAHSNNSVITGKFQGSLGKELVFRDWEGKTVVAKAPKRRSKDFTAVQLEVQERFQMATRYAKGVVDPKNPDKSLAEAYATVLRPRQNVYSRALEDFAKVPKVKTITTRNYKGAVGDKIVIRAVDDFRVTGVKVEVLAANGTLLEEGNAVVNVNGLDWTFTATQVNNLLAGSKIRAIATDVPGNEGTLEVTL